MRYVDREVNRDRSRIWCNPIFWWHGWDRDAYIAKHNLPINEVSATLGMSGECLCGAYAHPGELALIRCIDAPTADRITRLEGLVLASGFPWGWEGKPPTGFDRNQRDAFSINIII